MNQQYERVCALLTDTVMLMCKNGVQFNTELKVQGLIGLTADKDVFIIQINEVIKAEDENIKVQKPKKIVDSSRFTDFERKTTEKKMKQHYESIKKSSPISTSVSSPKQISNSQSTVSSEKQESKNDNYASDDSYHISINPQNSYTNGAEEMNYSLSNEQATDNFVDSNTLNHQESPEQQDNNMSEHIPLDMNIEQDSPIDLHIGSIPSWSNNFIESQVNGLNQSGDDSPDVKPSANDLEDWAANNMSAPVPIPSANHSALSLLKLKSEKRRYTDQGRKQSNSAINLKTNNSFSCSSPLQSIDHKQQLLQNYASNHSYNHNGGSGGGVSDDFNQSRYACSLCTAAYKHYCNLLTHEVKVHGRQKKKGGRRKKLDE